MASVVVYVEILHGNLMTVNVNAIRVTVIISNNDFRNNSS